MREISVTLGERTYPILIEAGSLNQIGERFLERFSIDSPVLVLTDDNVARIYLENVQVALEDAGFRSWDYVITAGETSKRLEVVSKVYDFLIEKKAPRGVIVVGLGGGVVGDITSFIASTYKRGVPYIALPTTLLAQVDSSVGGKTGVHHRGEKNVIGTIYQPQFVLIDTDCLSTLPKREFLAGMAEVVKQGAIKNPEFFAYLEHHYRDILNLEQDDLLKTVGDCCQLKSDVVAEDEFDERARHVLNYGHTVAHALEGLTGFRHYMHGEAVSIGMVAAAKVSLAVGKCSADDVVRQERLLRSIGLPTRLEKHFILQLLDHLYADKKRVGDEIMFVVCTGIGSADIWPVKPERLVELLSAI
ncbi:MAG: 3-dehydroquinate synthase [Candidatus Coatesbacteria bacterium]|nr:3-dehydroquinate synthase [Candidatus Coatesbacteria bacterium]